MNYRQALLEKLEPFDFGRQGQPLPVVSLEDFFVGNVEVGSIGCNLIEHPGLPFFFETLKTIRNKANVQDVLVEITDIDTLGDPFYEWAFSDRVYVITSANQSEVEQWVKPLLFDEIGKGWTGGKPHPSAPPIYEGNTVYAVWWD